MSIILTHPSIDPEGNGALYLFLVKITAEELNQKKVGDVLTGVFRCKIVKNADTGEYEQTECKKGSSPVVEYESLGNYYGEIKSFAVSGGKIIWVEE